jgi:hypothetical protein
MLTQIGFVWPQSYGAPSCNVGSSGFSSSLSTWTERLNAGNELHLYIGGASWELDD